MAEDVVGHCWVTRRRYRLVVGWALWVLVFAAIALSWSHRRNSFSGAESEELNGGYGGSVPKLMSVPLVATELPEFQLLNQRGEAVTKAVLLGEPWIASFIFTRCSGSCPKVVAQLRILQDRMKAVPVRFVSFSVQPENDSPEVLAQYAEAIGADPERWIFLTGEKDVIHGLVRRGFQQYVAPARSENPEPGWEVEHTNNVCLVDKDGRVVGKYNSLDEVEVAKLRRDVDGLVKVAGARTKD